MFENNYTFSGPVRSRQLSFLVSLSMRKLNRTLQTSLMNDSYAIKFLALLLSLSLHVLAFIPSSILMSRINEFIRISAILRKR